MIGKKALVPFALALATLLFPGSMAPRANASSPTIIRFASLAPAGSAFMKVMKAWNRSLKEKTEGRVELRFYSGGSQGDERDFVRKIRVGQMDAAGVSTTGLGLVSRPIFVLTAPGLITSYEQFDRAKAALTERFAGLFREAGFELLDIGEGGKNRIFSTEEFARPDDLKSLRPWAWKDDPVFAELISVIGANPVRVGMPEVYGGLQTRMVDTVPVSAIVAIAVQWHTKLNFVTKQNFSLVMGGSFIKSDVFERLTEHDQKVLRETAIQSGKVNARLTRRDDDRAYDALVKRGIVQIDLSPHQAEWDAISKKTRENLAGRVYSKSLLEAVERAVAP